jgi:hypothetical protein
MRILSNVCLIFLLLRYVIANDAVINNANDFFKSSLFKYCNGKLMEDFCSRQNIEIMFKILREREKVLLEKLKNYDEQIKIKNVIEKNKKLKFLKDFYSIRLF